MQSFCHLIAGGQHLYLICVAQKLLDQSLAGRQHVASRRSRNLSATSPYGYPPAAKSFTTQTNADLIIELCDFE